MRIDRPTVSCPICGDQCTGILDLHRHQAAHHSAEEIEKHREETEAAEFECNHELIRRQERLDNFIEFGG